MKIFRTVLIKFYLLIQIIHIKSFLNYIYEFNEANYFNKLIDMKKICVFVFLIILVFLHSRTSFAQITVDSISGNLNHQGSITIFGTGFGTKSPAAPLMWDDCESGTPDSIPSSSPNNSSQVGYSEVQPREVRNGDAIPLTHRTRYIIFPYTPEGENGPLTTITSPHDYSLKCISGGHYYEVGFNGNNGARDVQVTIPTAAGIGNFSEHWYAHWYYRVNSDFPSCGSKNNHKTSCIQSDIVAYGGSTYSNDFQYLNYANPLTPCITDSSGLNLRHQNDIGDCDDYTAAGRNNSFANTRYEWQIWEEFVSDNANDGMRVAMIDNDSVWVCLDKGAWFTAYAGQGIGSFTIGGYFRLNIDPPAGGEQSSDAHRLFDDIYVDDTFSRVMIGDSATYTSCTIIEPQIPTAWGDDSISCSVNLGRLQMSSPIYLFVFNDDNNHNPSGFPINSKNPSTPKEVSVKK